MFDGCTMESAPLFSKTWVQKIRIDTVLPWCFILFVFALSFSIAFAHVALGLWLLAWLVGLAMRQTRWRGTPLDRAVLVFLAVDLLTGIFGIRPAGSLVHFISLWHIAIYLLVVNTITDRRWLERALAVLIITTSVNATFGIVQHFWGGPYLFKDQRWWADSITRELGTFDHPMTFAGQMMLIGLVGTALLLWRRKSNAQWWLPSTIILAAWMLTYTRNAWVGGLTGAMVLALMKGKRAVMGIGFAVIILTTLVSILEPAFISRIKSIVDPTKFSNLERINMWRASLEMAKESPILGVGPGNYTEASGPYREKYGVVSTSSPHNNYFLQLTEKGVLGLGVFIYLWFVFFKEIWHAWRNATDDLSKALAAGSMAALVGFHVAGFFEGNFGHSEVVMIMWLIVGLGMWVRIYGNPKSELLS